MRPPSRWALLAVLLVVFAATAVLAGRHREPSPIVGVERLGPEAGEPVADYLRRAAGSLRSAGESQVWALVQLDGYLGPVAAAALIRGARLSVVVVRVPLPDVQTALVFRDVPGQRPVAELSAATRAAGRQRARVAAQAPPAGRLAAVAAVEATRLQAGCACVLALLVRADGDTLRELSGRPGARAVHTASSDATRRELALSPLLPEQRDVVGPVRDDGPVPPQRS